MRRSVKYFCISLVLLFVNASPLFFHWFLRKTFGEDARDVHEPLICFNCFVFLVSLAISLFLVVKCTGMILAVKRERYFHEGERLDRNDVVFCLLAIGLSIALLLAAFTIGIGPVFL